MAFEIFRVIAIAVSVIILLLSLRSYMRCYATTKAELETLQEDAQDAIRERREVPQRLNVWVGYRGWNANFKRAALRQVLVIKRGGLIHVAPAGPVRLIVSRDSMEE